MKKPLVAISLALSLLLTLPTACQTNDGSGNPTGNPTGNPSTDGSLTTSSSTDTNGTSDGTSAGTELKIYASFYPIYDFTKTIVGDTATVENLMPAGSDLHDFEPSAADLVALHQADMLIYQGAGLEPWLDNVKATLEQDGANVTFVEAAKDLPLLSTETETEDDHTATTDEHGHEVTPATDEHGHEVTPATDDHDDHDETDEHAGHDHGGVDPHVWLNPALAVRMMENIKNALSEKNPAEAATYQANYDAAKVSLEALDAEFRTKLSETSRKSFIITHEAFAYLADAYGLTQYGVTGVGVEQDPSPDRMAELVSLAKAEGITTIYYEASGSDKIAQTLASEVGAQVMPLYTIESPGADESGNYLSLMRKNLENLLAGFAN